MVNSTRCNVAGRRPGITGRSVRGVKQGKNATSDNRGGSASSVILRETLVSDLAGASLSANPRNSDTRALKRSGCVYYMRGNFNPLTVAQIKIQLELLGLKHLAASKITKLNHNTVKLSTDITLHNKDTARITREKLRPAAGWRILQEHTCPLPSLLATGPGRM